MPVTCVIGLQWGDEAKGKLVDLLTEQHDIVVRYQGGSNAGHTVVRQGQTYKLSLVPSGIFRPEVQCVIASGVVVNPASLVAEIDGLAGRGIAIGQNLMLSNRAHVIFPWHIEEDRLAEQQCGGRGDRHHDARHRPLLPRQVRPRVGRSLRRHVPARFPRGSSGSRA